MSRRQFDKELFPARDPSYVPPHLIVAYDFGEANSPSVVRPAAVGRNTPNGYVDPGILSSSTAAARPGEANISQGVVNLNTPPRPYHHDAYRDDKSAFNVEFRVETPPGFPSRVYARPHFYDEEDAFLDRYWARYDKELYEDGMISAETYKARLQDLRQQQQHRRERQRQAEARQQDKSNAGSSSAADAAASETIAMGTDTDTLDFPSVVSSEVVSGTTAPAASTPSDATNNVTATDVSSEVDGTLNTGFAASSAESSSTASVAEPSAQRVAEQSASSQMSIVADEHNTGFAVSGNSSNASNAQPSVSPSAQSTVSSIRQPASNEIHEYSVDLMRGDEILEGEQAENFCAKLRFRPKHQPRQHAEVEANMSMDEEEEDSDEIQDLSTSFSLIGLTSRSTDVDDEIDAMSTSLANISVATSQNNIAVDSNFQNTVAASIVLPVCVASTVQPSPSIQLVVPEEPVSQIVSAVNISSNTESTQPSSIDAMSTSSANINVAPTNAPQVVEPMDVDPILESLEVDEVPEKMEIDQVPEEHRSIENDTDIEMFDESIVSTQTQRITAEEHANSEVNAIIPAIGSDHSIQSSPHAVSSNNSGFFSSMNTVQVIENMEVDAAMTPEEAERPIVNETHSAESFDSSASNLESNKTLESSETSSSMPTQPASETSIAMTATPEVMREIPTDKSSSESLRENSSADQGPDSSSKPASDIQSTNDVEKSLDMPEKDEVHESQHAATDSKTPQSSRNRLNDIVEHHRRRAMLPIVRFSPQHSVMKRRSNTVQRSRLALVCHINRRRNQQMMQIKPYEAVVEKPVIEVAAHHQRRRELTAAAQTLPESSMPRPTTTGRSRLALIEANRARIQPTPTPIAHHPSAVNAEVPKSVVAAEPVSSASVSHRDQINDVPSGSASSQPIECANVEESNEYDRRPQEQLIVSSLPQRKFRSSHLERAFAKQRRQAPITRQELEDILVRIEEANRNQHPDTAVPPSPRRPFQTRTARIWDGMKDDGRPIRRAIQRPRQFYSNEESFVKRKQEGAECQATTATASDTPRPSTPREIAVEVLHQPAEVSDNALQEPAVAAEAEDEVVVPEAAVENVLEDLQSQEDQNVRANRAIHRYSRSTRRNFHRLQYDADSEKEPSTSRSNKKAEKSHKKGVRKCNHPHMTDVPKHLCNHDNAEIMRQIARRFVLCHLCGMPIAPRLITSTDNELTESDESGVDDFDADLVEVGDAPQAHQDDEIERESDSSSSNGAEQQPEAPIDEVMNIENGADSASDHEAVPTADIATVPAPPHGHQVEDMSVDREVNELPENNFFDEVPGLDPMSEPEEADITAQSDASESAPGPNPPSSRKRRRSNTTDREPSVEQPRRDDSPPGDSSHNEDPSNGSADDSSDDEAPPPPRRRRRVNRGEWGQLRHILDIEGANLPDAPPFVARQREVYGDISLAATEQIQVVRGNHFVAALYRSGLVVYQGEYRGAPTGAAIFREARHQPVLVWQDVENRIVRIAAGDNHLAMLSVSGEVHTIGRSEEGQLGIPNLRGFRQSVVTPTSTVRSILDAAGQNVFVTDIRAHGNVTEAKTRNGTVYRCGDGVLQFTELQN